MIQVYFGYGKGKTTASIGAGMRCFGANKKVVLVQFLKDNKSSELNSLPFEVYESPNSLPFNPDNSYQEWINNAINYILNVKADMIILDEFLDIYPKFINESQIEQVINLPSEVIITGHQKIEVVFEKADYITEFTKIKHPFDKGVKARKGIEY